MGLIELILSDALVSSTDFLLEPTTRAGRGGDGIEGRAMVGTGVSVCRGFLSYHDANEQVIHH